MNCELERKRVSQCQSSSSQYHSLSHQSQSKLSQFSHSVSQSVSPLPPSLTHLTKESSYRWLIVVKVLKVSSVKPLQCSIGRPFTEQRKRLDCCKKTDNVTRMPNEGCTMKALSKFFRGLCMSMRITDPSVIFYQGFQFLAMDSERHAM